MNFNAIHLKVSNIPIVFQLNKFSMDARVHSAHGLLNRCDIGAKNGRPLGD
jgi:hypothetical protein